MGTHCPSWKNIMLYEGTKSFQRFKDWCPQFIIIIHHQGYKISKRRQLHWQGVTLLHYFIFWKSMLIYPFVTPTLLRKPTVAALPPEIPRTHENYWLCQSVAVLT